MTLRLYLEDPYLRSFKAKVVRTDGEKVVLDRTAFYPGGGGQQADRGTIDGLNVEGMMEDGDIYHLVPGHDLRPGDEVEGTIDWESRHDLMRGHTAEHLIFSRLQRRIAEVELVKISITTEKKSLVVRGALTLKDLGTVQSEVNDLIQKDINVHHTWLSKEKAEREGIRARMDRISGERVRVVRIGDIDAAACAGIHVASTGEIGSVLITALRSARPEGDYEVVFEVGGKATRTALSLAHHCLTACEAIGSHPEDLRRAVKNLRADASMTRAALRECGRRLLRNLTPEEYHGREIYSAVLPMMDRKELIAAANDLAQRGSACVLITTDNNLMMVVACHPEIKVDCRKILNRSLQEIGGRGGGKPHFATGGAPTADGADRVLGRALDILKRELMSE